MRRVEAESLIGSLVETSYIHGAKYYGYLVSITDSKPFRAIVKVVGISYFPRLYGHNTSCSFLPYEPKIICKDEIVETGNSIRSLSADKLDSDFEESLMTSLTSYLKDVQQHLDRYVEYNGHMHSYYIASLDDNIKLRDLLVEKIEKLL